VGGGYSREPAGGGPRGGASRSGAGGAAPAAGKPAPADFDGMDDDIPF
jgi:hypothetical protein